MKLSLIIVFVIGFAMYWYGNKKLNKLEEKRKAEQSDNEKELDREH